MTDTKNKRRRYLVNRKLQMQFSWLLVIQLAIPTVILGIFLYIVNKMYLSTIQRLVGSSVISDPYIQSILNFSVLAIAVFLLASSMLLIFLGIRLSHHIAGPLYKLEQTLDKLAKGEKVKPLVFRKTDIIDSLAEKFNAIAERLDQLKK